MCGNSTVSRRSRMLMELPGAGRTRRAPRPPSCPLRGEAISVVLDAEALAPAAVALEHVPEVVRRGGAGAVAPDPDVVGG